MPQNTMNVQETALTGGFAGLTEKGLVPSEHISSVKSTLAEQEIKKLETAELLMQEI